MEQKVVENTKSILKETGLKLKEVQILPDTLLYVNLYHLALAIDNTGKHELSKNICHALLNELEKHVHQNKSQQQLDIQDEIDKTIKFVCESVRNESIYSEQRAELIKALAELVSARAVM